MIFKNILNKWYQQNRRDLPWRDSVNPYYVWVSEIILQQTRVAQGLSYYARFLKLFPTVQLLANAHEDEVLKAWQGLGYYTRARNMHRGAKLIVDKYKGELPKSYSELLNIYGIGSYSAGAIASFAFKQVVPAIDGNVYRVMARIFGVFASPHTAKGKREFHCLVMDLIDTKEPHIFNQALLDFGALQCVPKNPNCSICPFNTFCYAFRNNLINSLPVRAKRTVPKDRFFIYLLIRCQGLTYIQKRTQKDIWHSLYQFPLIETTSLLKENEIGTHPQWKRIFGKSTPEVKYISPIVRHQLSHQTLHTRFVIVDTERETKFLNNHFIPIETENISNYSTPRLIDSFLAAEPATKYFLNPPK
jgi:A/G-specific adenine glycosylase